MDLFQPHFGLSQSNYNFQGLLWRTKQFSKSLRRCATSCDFDWRFLDLVVLEWSDVVNFWTMNACRDKTNMNFWIRKWYHINFQSCNSIENMKHDKICTRPFGSGMADRQHFGWLETWPNSCNQIPTMRSPIVRIGNNGVFHVLHGSWIWFLNLLHGKKF